MRFAAALVALLAAAAPARAADNQPPVVTDLARAQAAQVAAMDDAGPVGRLNQILAASKLDRAALFVLASTHPGIVEQVISKEYEQVISFIDSLPPPELHRIRRGETVIRNNRVLTGVERKRAVVLAQRFDFPKFKEEKISAVRIGPIEGRYVRVEVAYRHKKKKMLHGSMEMAWPSTPERDEATRTELARHFGARPSAAASGSGSILPLVEGSFESADALGTAWVITEALSLEPGTPRGDVNIDDATALDGTRSLRFHNTEDTRWFPAVQQEVAVQPGIRVTVQAQFRAENLRVEYLQREDYVGMSLTWLDPAGNAMGPPTRAIGRLSTHGWEPMTIQGAVPPGAGSALLQVSSTVSGTAWFDGVSIQQQ